MWSSEPTRRNLILGCGALVLAGCGFQPVFGPGSAAGQLFGRVALQDPSDSDTFALNDRLRERLGSPVDVAWRLNYQLSTRNQGFSADGATRTQIEGRLNWRLTRLADDQPVASGIARSFVGLSEIPSERGATFAPVSNRTAENDARDRLMTILADQLVRDLAAKMAAGS